jgi:uncharacterized protein YecE (DUF72 family)
MSDALGTPLFPAPEPAGAESRIVIGTSGYSFPDWVGPFYPPGIRSADFLGYYARHFSAVEVNATYYRMPSARTLEQMERKTPPGFRFVVKLHQSMTHEGARDPALYDEFRAALAPLKAAGKYDGLLAQFPWSFKQGPAALDHLSVMRGRLPGEPLFVEFRHDSWLVPELPRWLRERGLGFCAVDEPPLRGLMPPVTMVTAADAYVRFHGRNAANWWGRGAEGEPERDASRSAGVAPATRDAPAPRSAARPGPSSARPPSGDRYDYDYSEAELREWVRRIAELAEQARRTYLFFNNCHAGQAARNAMMQELLRQQNLPA